MAKFDMDFLGLEDLTGNTQEVEISFYDLLDKTVKANIRSNNQEFKDIMSKAWAEARLVLEPIAEAMVLRKLAGINAIEAGGNVYTLAEALERQFELFKQGKAAKFPKGKEPKGWKSYTVETTDKNDDGVRWLPAAQTDELEALRSKLGIFNGMSIAKQRTLAAKAASYGTNTKSLEL
jgi:hypothetical protein